MRLADKIATMARRGAPLPYMRRVAYLGSNTGTQYIDTGINYFADFEIDCIGLTKITSYNRLLGNQSSASVRAISSSNNCWTLYPGGVITSVTCYDRHLISWKNNVLTVDGETVGEYIKSFTNGKLFLFAYGTTSIGRVNIYSCKLYSEDGELVRDFIPVLDLSGRPAMYDEVSGQLFYNQGTGEFTWGELET